MTATQVSASLTRKGLLSIHGGEGVRKSSSTIVHHHPLYPYSMRPVENYSPHSSAAVRYNPYMKCEFKCELK